MMKKWLLLIIVLSLFTPLLTVQAQQNRNENCVVTPLQLRGQAQRGLTGAAGETLDTIDIASQSASLDYLGTVVAAVGSGTQPVAILIVDEFPPNMNSNNQGNRPAATTHGELVLEVFEQLVTETGLTNITLVPVNVAAGQSGKYRTSTLAREIERTMEDLQEDGIQRFVINMSFALVPCQDGDFDFDRFNNGRGNDPTQSLVSNRGNEQNAVRLLEKTADMGKLDPLHILLVNLLAQNTSDSFAVIAVGSAGNFGATQPFYPAGWPEVISVSASEGASDPAAMWGSSNNGAIMTPGAWYAFSDNYYRAGTSFAAPVMSVIAALYLSYDQIPCTLTGGTAPLVDVTLYENQTYDAALNCTLP